MENGIFYQLSSWILFFIYLSKLGTLMRLWLSSTTSAPGQTYSRWFSLRTTQPCLLEAMFSHLSCILSWAAGIEDEEDDYEDDDEDDDFEEEDEEDVRPAKKRGGKTTKTTKKSAAKKAKAAPKAKIGALDRKYMLHSSLNLFMLCIWRHHLIRCFKCLRCWIKSCDETVSWRCVDSCGVLKSTHLVGMCILHLQYSLYQLAFVCSLRLRSRSMLYTWNRLINTYVPLRCFVEFWTPAPYLLFLAWKKAGTHSMVTSPAGIAIRYLADPIAAALPGLMSLQIAGLSESDAKELLADALANDKAAGNDINM